VLPVHGLLSALKEMAGFYHCAAPLQQMQR
jgi:hypothetical protein